MLKKVSSMKMQFYFYMCNFTVFQGCSTLARCALQVDDLKFKLIMHLMVHNVRSCVVLKLSQYVQHKEE